MKIVQWFVSIVCVATCFGHTETKSSKPIAVVICSFNNVKFYQRNLESVLDQDYSNYRIIYVDDCSPDGTADAVEEFVNNHPNKHRFHLVRNKSRRKAMENLWNAIHMCSNDEIVITLDGDDWLPHNNVLNIVASYYEDPNVWVAYSNYLTHPYKKSGISRPWNQSRINSVGVRKHPYIVSHLRSFYAGLFKQVKLQDLTYNGAFVPTTYDLAMFFPMLEMAADHIRFMKEKLYVYNVVNPISDCKVHRQMQAKIDKYTRRLKPYQPLNFHPAQKNESLKDQKVDLIVYSDHRPTELHAFLESLYRQAKHYNDVHVIYRSDNSDYEIVKNSFPNVIWKKQEQELMTIQAAFDDTSHAKYIAFATDDIIIKDKLDFQDAARLLNKAKGFAFLLSLGKETNRNSAVPRFMQIEPDVFASQADKGDCCGRINNFDMTIYHKEDIKACFDDQLNFTSPQCLVEKKDIMLCYKMAKVAKTP